jgi:hypothetical protein
MRVPIPNRKSQARRLLDRVNDSLDVPRGIKSRAPSLGSDNVRRAGVIAAALTGLTAGSAGISLLRRNSGEARDDS